MRYIIILLFLVSCRDFKAPEEILKKEGYTNVSYLSHDMWACRTDGKTHHSIHFKAIKDGKEVKGNICYTYEGSYSIEIKKPW